VFVLESLSDIFRVGLVYHIGNSSAEYESVVCLPGWLRHFQWPPAYTQLMLVLLKYQWFLKIGLSGSVVMKS
jgi:hypothetical protein